MRLFGLYNIHRLQARRNVAGLLEALGYRSRRDRGRPPGVRRKAAAALGAIGDPRAIDALTHAMVNDKDRAVRESATVALGAIGDPRAIPAITTVLHNPERRLRRAATEALDTLGWHPGSDDDGAAYWATKGQWETCAQMGGCAIQALTVALRNGEHEDADKAAAALAQIGEPAIDSLAKAAGHWDSWVTSAAAEALGAIGGPRAVEALVQAMRHNLSNVGVAAIRALGTIGDPSAIPVLTGYLLRPSSSSYVAGAAAAALGAIGDPRAIDALAEAANSKDVSGSAAEALGAIGGPRAVEALVQALRHNTSNVGVAAIRALGTIGDPSAIPVLIDYLLHSPTSSSVTEEAAAALARIGGPRAVEALDDALRHNLGDVRGGIVRALGSIGGPSAVDALIRALERALDGNEFDVRDEIASALTEIDGTGIIRLAEVRGTAKWDASHQREHHQKTAAWAAYDYESEIYEMYCRGENVTDAWIAAGGPRLPTPPEFPRP